MTTTIDCTVIHIKEFLRLKPSGEFDPDATLRVLGTLSELLASSGDPKTLIDIREAYPSVSLTTYDIYLFVKELVQKRKTFHNKIAILTRKDYQFDNAKFFELCAGNRGLDAKAFTEYEAVIDWFSETKVADMQNV